MTGTSGDTCPSSTSVMKVGFSAGVFPDADQRDVQAAMQLWTKQLALGMGIKGQPQTIIYTSTEELLAAVKQGELTVVSLPALDYLRIRRRAPMSPALVSSATPGKSAVSLSPAATAASHRYVACGTDPYSSPPEASIRPAKSGLMYCCFRKGRRILPHLSDR